jgi:hypothetical protein
LQLRISSPSSDHGSMLYLFLFLGFLELVNTELVV